MRIYYRRGGKGAAPDGFDRVYTEVDGSGSILRELLAYVRAGDSVTVEMGGELGGTAGAFVEMALALYRQQAKIEANELSISAACRQMNIGTGTYYRMRDQYKKERSVPNVPNLE